MNIICYLLPSGPGSNAAPVYAALEYSLWRPAMKQASAAAVHRQVFSEVRGKRTARVCDSDVNTVYLSAVCVHTDFPRRPLSEPGCRPPERLKGSAGLFELCCGISSRQLFGQTHTLRLLRYQICIPKKQDTIDQEF